MLVPGIALAIPQYLLLAKVGLTNTYWSVLLPSILSPYGIYLARIYAAAAIPDALLEAARTDGAGELRIFASIAAAGDAARAGDGVPVPVRGDLEQLPAAVHHAQRRPQVPAHGRPLHAAQPGQHQPALYTLVITGALLSIIPLVALFLTLQRYWRVDLFTGAVKA